MTTTPATKDVLLILSCVGSWHEEGKRVLKMKKGEMGTTQEAYQIVNTVYSSEEAMENKSSTTRPKNCMNLPVCYCPDWSRADRGIASVCQNPVRMWQLAATLGLLNICQYRALCANGERSLSALWGKLAA